MRSPAIGSGQRYRAGVQLSDDSLGTLWKGTDVRSGSTVTIRLLDERLVSDPQAVHRATARLRWAQFEAGNAHLTRVLDHSLRPGGRQPFVVSEGVSGETLSQHLNREALSLRQALEVFAAVAEGVAYAHAAWIHHGSITGASILMDDRSVAKVVDVGLGELLDDSDTRQRAVRAARFEDREATDVLAVAHLLEEVLARCPRPPEIATEDESGIAISVELGDLIQRALSPYGLHRPTMGEFGAALASDLDAISSSGTTRYAARRSPVTRPHPTTSAGVERHSRSRSGTRGPAEDLPSASEDDRVERVSGAGANNGDVSERLMASAPTPVPPADAPVEPPPVEPPPVEPPPVEPPPVEPPPVEPPPVEPPPVEPPPTERPPAEGAPGPTKRAHLARPRLPVALGAGVVVLGLIVGAVIASRGTDAEDHVGDPVRPTLTPPAMSVPPSPEPVVAATVPTVLGQPLGSATGLIEREGLVVGSVTTVPGEEGVVVRTDPTQGEAVPAGTVVDIFVGSGADGAGV